jgi:hypothetical protein
VSFAEDERANLARPAFLGDTHFSPGGRLNDWRPSGVRMGAFLFLYCLAFIASLFLLVGLLWGRRVVGLEGIHDVEKACDHHDAK